MKDDQGVISAKAFKCERCDNVGYYKFGLCLECRQKKCLKCGKIFLIRNKGERLCAICRISLKNKARAYDWA